MIEALGVDGCRGGWVVASAHDDGHTHAEMFRSISDIAAWRRDHAPVANLLVDIPIGLLERVGFRPCDEAAREVLGVRRSCVFQVPDRALLELVLFSDVQGAIATRRLTEPAARGLAQQGFGILPKIAEVDAYLREHEGARTWILEMHPEVSFRVLAGRDLAPKKTAVGQSERLAVLQPVFKDVATSVQEIRCTISGALLGLHDVLDAYAALWTALRVRAGHAKILGDMTSDRCGLPMRMFV